MLRVFLVAMGLCLMAFAQPAEARKVALVIGNSAYQNATQLANPANDAALIASAAQEAGFDDVAVMQDLGIEAFRNALREFGRKAEGAEVAMIYFAGHGIEGKGKNWLIPTDAKLNSSIDLPYESVDLDLVMEALSGAQIRMAILDACRNNPFGRQWTSGTRAVTRGLIGVEADDVLVIYAAAPGQTAFDGDGDNSPFAASLARRLPESGVPVQLLGGLVRDDVLSVTGGEQRPFISASITGTPIYLVPGASTIAVQPQQLNGQVRLSEITIETLKLSGIFGLPDNLFLDFGNGTRIPAEEGSSQKMRKGDIWQPTDSPILASGSFFRVMEHDAVGGHDLIGTVELPSTAGVHSVTLNGDKSEYRLTYRLEPAP